MARLPRLYAPGIPQLVQARFARPLATAQDPTPSERLDLLQKWLASELRARSIALHGWAILPDRFLLLATPAEADVIPQIMQGVGRRMAAGMMHGRAFESRYRGALVDDEWMLHTLIWLESSAATAGLVADPCRWPWSSAAVHAGLHPDPGLVSDPPCYWQLADTPYARQARYQERLRLGLNDATTQRIEQALFGQWALGDEDFMLRVRSRASRRVAPAPRGRPRKTAENGIVTK